MKKEENKQYYLFLPFSSFIIHPSSFQGVIMLIGRVVGSVVSTRKVESLTGLKLLAVRQMDVYGK